MTLGFSLLSDDSLLPPQTALLAVSPGVPPSHPLLQAALAQKVALATDLDLLYAAYPTATYVGITGTNGKSTTTALIGHILQQAGFSDVHIVGNIGTPVLSVRPTTTTPLFVIEASSYQLEYSQTFAVDVAVWLNITPDHLERHGTMAAYVAAKRRLFRPSNKPQTAIVAVEDEESQAVAAWLAAASTWRVVPVAAGSLPEGGVGTIGDTLQEQNSGETLAILRCLGCTTLKTPPPPPPPRGYLASCLLSCGKRCRVFLGCRIGRNAAAPSVAFTTLTTAKPLMPMPPKKPCVVTKIFSGLSADAPKPMALMP
jgi:UDP-N-acetylmuramoylalanine-D-glutamate ligase